MWNTILLKCVNSSYGGSLSYWTWTLHYYSKNTRTNYSQVICFPFWAPLCFSKILIWTNLHTVVPYYRTQWSLIIAPNGKQKFNLIHIRLEKDPYTAHYFKGFSNEPSYEVTPWNPILAAKAAEFIKESWFCHCSFSKY